MRKYSPYYDELYSVAKPRYDEKLNIMLPGCVDDRYVVILHLAVRLAISGLKSNTKTFLLFGKLG